MFQSKKYLEKTVENTNPNVTVKGLLQDLKTDKLPSVNSNISGEFSYGLSQNTNNDLIPQSWQETDIDNSIAVSLTPGLYYPVYMHTHTIKSLSMFSLSDIYAIYHGIQDGNLDENSVFYLVTDHGTQYAFIISDKNIFTYWAQQFFMGWNVSNLITNIREKSYEKYVNMKNSLGTNEKGLVKFLFEQFAGLQLMKTSSNDFSNWQALDYDELHDKITSQNCP